MDCPSNRILFSVFSWEALPVIIWCTLFALLAELYKIGGWFIHCSWGSPIWRQNPRAQASGQVFSTLLNSVNNSILLNNLCGDYSDVKEILLPDWGEVKVLLVTRPRNSAEINSGRVFLEEGGSRREFKKGGAGRDHPSPVKVNSERL